MLLGLFVMVDPIYFRQIKDEKKRSVERETVSSQCWPSLQSA